MRSNALRFCSRGGCFAALLAMCAVLTACGPQQATITVGSKSFTESYLLAEIFAQLLEARGMTVTRKPGLGGTLICYRALREGEIDVYPEYTGTIAQAILKRDGAATPEQLAAELQPLNLSMLAPLGFDNSYALVIRAPLARQLGLSTISQLREHRDLRLAFSHEFIERADGWRGLAANYGLPQRPSSLEHGLAYQAIEDDSIDLTDAYATDGELLRYDLTVLSDDRAFFPNYVALPLTRTDLPAAARHALQELRGRIDAQRMRELNAEAVVKGRPMAAIAAQFLAAEGLASSDAAPTRSWLRDLRLNTLRHLQLTGLALLLACLVGVPAAIAVHRSQRLSATALYVAGLLQTIPSIALLALMIPLFGIGFLPAIIALFLYSLLPILRNTITALRTIDPLLRRVAEGMGLTPREQVRHVLLPLALPNVLAGIRTAAVISIGTATLAAFIGAGGLGQPIYYGLTLNDTSLILQGAIPAALLALLTEFAFEALERRIIPAHLRSGSTPH